jgi:ATP-dependent RNA helicase DDX41
MYVCVCLCVQGCSWWNVKLPASGTTNLQSENVIVFFNRGVHIVVATPGRLMDLLDKKFLNVAICR